jgi:4-diphosphocytidyl-2-C-methyl-D-erythritol kinase
MSAIDLCDTLHVEPTQVTSYHLAFADDAQLKQPIDWPIERDLAVRAHRALERYVGRPLPVRLTLEKRIPAGAGLGGGSADAAGTLHAINEAYGLDLPKPTRHALAATLGSDVAFALQAIAGSPHAIASGFGESLRVVHPRWNRCEATLLLPPFGCPTAEVYRAFDEVSKSTINDRGLPQSVAQAEILADDLLFNDLTDAAMRVQPQLREVFEAVRPLGKVPHLTGSGSAVFMLGPPTDHNTMRDRTGCVSIPVRIG